MAIVTVKEQGGSFFIYNEKGNVTGTVHGGTCIGHTGSTVSIKRSSGVHIYDEKGNQTRVIF
jgi:hypothetical protein